MYSAGYLLEGTLELSWITVSACSQVNQLSFFKCPGKRCLHSLSESVYFVGTKPIKCPGLFPVSKYALSL